jgi:hypothetical protein
LEDLRAAIQAHGVASWQAMEAGMSRRESNATAYRRKDDALLWTVAWKLPSGDSVRLSERAVPEDTLLVDALRLLIDASAATSSNTALLGELAVPDCAFLMRVEGSPANAPCFYLLPADESLRAALTGTNIIEYPTITVVPRTALAQFTVVPKPPPKRTSLVVIAEPDQTAST